jgi:hypothetical protein
MDITDTGYQNVNYTDLTNNGVQLYVFIIGNKSVGSTKAQNTIRCVSVKYSAPKSR